MSPNDERAAFESIIKDFELHYKNGPEMFASRSNFDEFIHTEVRFHSRLLNVDFEKVKKALVAWIKQNHASEYYSITHGRE